MKHKERSAFLCYHEDCQVAIRCLSDAQLGQLTKALFYASIGQEVEDSTLCDRVLPLYLMMRNKILRDSQRYEETCDKRKTSAFSRYQKTPEKQDDTLQMHANASTCMQTLPKETVTPEEDITLTPNEGVGEKEWESACIQGAAFAPPTPQEVEDYSLSLGQKLDGQRFCDYHSARGWTVGKSPMQDWRAVVRLWVREDKQKGASPPYRTPRQVSAQMYTQRQYTEEDLSFNDLALLKEAENYCPGAEPRRAISTA